MTRHPRLLLIALGIAALAVVGVAAPAPAAHAAAAGPGYDYRGDPHSHLGGYLNPDGTVSYCIDAGKSSPLGNATVDAGVVGQVNGLPPAAMMQLAYVLAAHGNTLDSDTAAAVALVVWGIADPVDHAARGGDGFVITRAPAARRADILAMAAAFRAEAAGYVVPPSGSAALTLTIAAIDPAHGVLEVAVTPAVANGSLALTNAVFTDTGLSTREGVADGARLEVAATPPTGAAEYEVSVAADFVGTGRPDGSVHVYSTPGAQALASAGTWVPDAIAATAEVRVVVPRLPRVAG